MKLSTGIAAGGMAALPPSPPMDINMVTALVGTDIVGSFPAVEMRKVDMRGYNTDRPLSERGASWCCIGCFFTYVLFFFKLTHLQQRYTAKPTLSQSTATSQP
jgi:hypothetical protein